MFINKDDLRRLANKKASRPIMGQGIPAPNEGIDGDFRLNNTPTGVKLYAKFAGQWFAFSPDNEASENKIWILNGAVVDAGYAEEFWPINSYPTDSQSSDVSNTEYDSAALLIPFQGRVKSISIRARYGSGDTSVNIYKIKSGTGSTVSAASGLLLESQSVTLEANRATSATFKAAEFNANEVLFFSHNVGTTTPPDRVLYSIVFEIDN